MSPPFLSLPELSQEFYFLQANTCPRDYVLGPCGLPNFSKSNTFELNFQEQDSKYFRFSISYNLKSNRMSFCLYVCVCQTKEVLDRFGFLLQWSILKDRSRGGLYLFLGRVPSTSLREIAPFVAKLLKYRILFQDLIKQKCFAFITLYLAVIGISI